MKVSITKVETTTREKVAKILRYICFLTAAVFMIDDVMQVYFAKSNFFLHDRMCFVILYVNFLLTIGTFWIDDEFLQNKEVPILVITRTLCLCSSVGLIYGVIHKHTTFLAVFLWTTLEMHVLYLILFCYKSTQHYLFSYERYLLWGIMSKKQKYWKVSL